MGATGGSSVIPLIINNESVVTENVFDVHAPATGEVLHQCAAASVDDANRAVAAAKAAFPAWSKMKAYDRRDVLMKAADIMSARAEELIKYQMEETGAGRMFAEKTCHLGAGFLRDFAARIPSIEGSVPITQDAECAMVLKQPYGVILGIAPW
jgi:acyl-CoA reductase-like NAD-dependent aldehyde dehydrogenase